MADKMYNCEMIRELLKFLPNRPDYGLWIQVISAIGNLFDEQTALRIILDRWPDEKPGETLYKIKHRIPNFDPGIITALARNHGYTQNPVKRKKASIYDIYQNFRGEPEQYYFFDDQQLEERAAIYQHDANMSRMEAERQVQFENPGANKLRTFHVAINSNVMDKNINPSTNEKYSDFMALTNGFQNFYLPIQGLIENILNGFAFAPCHFQLTGSKIIRRSENWACSDLLVLDVDEGLSIEQALNMQLTSKASFIYTTFNHTTEKNRFRIIFTLPRTIRDRLTYSRILREFISIYSSDKNCSDPGRAYFGNSNAIIFQNF